MPRRSTAPLPTDEVILRYANVPLNLAAKYIGWSNTTIRYALQEERAPFGIAARNPNTDTWAYNISPEALVKYKHGELEHYRLNDLVKCITNAVTEDIKIRLSSMREMEAISNV